jgi:hypothetical protein
LTEEEASEASRLLDLRSGLSVDGRVAKRDDDGSQLE